MTKHHKFRINVIGFSLIGTVFYVYTFFRNPSTITANPLYVEGIVGVPISVIGASFTYYYFRYKQVPIYKIALMSIALFLLWMVGVMTIATELEGLGNRYAAVAWIGLLTIMYFMLLGAINGFLGYWISLFNVFLVGLCLYSVECSAPLLWLYILGMVGIENATVLWGIVLISAILGVSDKGFGFFFQD